jgi:hypothetical protein
MEYSGHARFSCIGSSEIDLHPVVPDETGGQPAGAWEGGVALDEGGVWRGSRWTNNVERIGSAPDWRIMGEQDTSEEP